MPTDLTIGVLDDRGDGVSDRDYVNSLARGLEVMRAFTRHKPKMTLSEVASATGMTRATARRFLLTLNKEGYVESNGRLFSLRPKVLELGFSVLSSMDIWQVAQPVMDELAERIQESVFAAVLDGDSVIYIARAASDRVISIGIHVGNRSPAYSVSTGRVLLAALPDDALDQYFRRVKLTAFTPNTVTSKARLRETIAQTRRRGWSIVDEEQEIGLRSLSVPIKGRGGFTVAALNICCPTPRWTIKDMQARLVDELIDASARITAGLDG